jgi:hypothetical protein
MSSILNDVKHMLGLLPEQTAFDSDIMIHINSVFSTLTQLGVGDPLGFMIEDNTTDWDEFVNDAQLNSVKSYMFLRVKLFFDPPQVGFVITSMDRQIEQLEWRLLVAADTPYLGEDEIVGGGGA